jgi:tetratricopeptide (TPR) repeat protein
MILNSIEQILSRVVAQPIPATLADLRVLADSQPTEALPWLAMAIVTSFTQAENVPAARGYLQKAQTLLKPEATDPEQTFARALAGAIEPQLTIVDATMHRQVRELPSPGERMGRLGISARELPSPLERISQAKMQAAAQNAVAQLHTAAAANPDSTLAQVVSALFQAFSQASTTGSQQFSDGVAGLTRYKAGGPCADLAAFFLTYAYRRSQQYPHAIAVASELEKRQPNSPLIKKVIGSCHFFSNEFVKADQYYRQALTLSKEDPSILLSLAQTHANMGDVTAAKQYADRAAQADVDKKFTPFIEPFHAQLRTFL